jgi:tetratricopeptide (TPR) repeat protein
MSDKPTPLSLPGIEEFSKMLRTMFINIGFFGATLLLIPSVAGQLTRTAIIIDPIAVPEAMVAQGLTPEVVANRIWDGLQDFAATASANRETIAAIPDSQLIEFSLPDAGVSIDSIFAQIRQFFQIYETRIGGEYVCATADCDPAGMQLRLRVVKQHSDVIDLPAMGAMSERDYYREAAAGIYEIIDPYVAIAAQAETAPLKAATLARGLTIEGGKDAKWAHNLVGDIEAKGGNAAEAVTEYRAALVLDPDFSVARASLARTLFETGDRDGARAELAELERRDPKNKLLPTTRATLALTEGDKPEAIRQSLLAAELDPLQPGHFTLAGSLELELGHFEQGTAYLREALSIDPGFGGAIDTLAQAEANNQNLPEAVKLYRQWLDFEPDNLDARTQLGVVLQANGELQEAVQHLRIAHDAGKRGMAAQMLAVSLFKLNRFDDVIAVLQPIVAEDATAYAETVVLGKSLVRAGRPGEAIDLYESFLAAAPADDPNRTGLEGEIAAIRKDYGL